LATLYYETEDYARALRYAEKMQDSRDSLMMRGCYFHLYRIHARLGDKDVSHEYYKKYTDIHDAIQERVKTKEVAVIPHKVEKQMLVEENQKGRVLRGWLMAVIVVLTMSAFMIHRNQRNRHQRKQDEMSRKILKSEEMHQQVQQELAEKDLELTESQASLNEAKHSLAKTQDELVATKVSLGQMKGMQARQGDAVGRVKTVLEETKRKHQKEIARLKDCIKNLEADIFLMKEKERERKYTETELMQNFKMLKKQLKEKTDKLVLIEHQREIDLRIGHFVMHGRDAIAVDMLLQFRYGEEVQARYDIRSDEYIPMLRELLEQENPSLAEKLEKCELERKKLTMCYLMALGLDDVEMMARAACLAPNSVKAYRKECRELVQSLESKV
jgi:tetratricopeptide (TPR) repeat protein